MDCSICLSAIGADTSSTTTSCGHSFHFDCIAKWSRTSSACPLCRQTFTKNTPYVDVQYSRPTIESYRPIIMSGRVNPDEHAGRWEAYLRRKLQERYDRRPIEQVPTEGLDPIDVEFVAEMAGVDEQTARAYIAFYKDPVEVVTFISHDPDRHPIPEFRERERPRTDYTPRSIVHRTGMTALTVQMYDNGYESV
jgi:hypothetical protein